MSSEKQKPLDLYYQTANSLQTLQDGKLSW